MQPLPTRGVEYRVHINHTDSDLILSSALTFSTFRRKVGWLDNEIWYSKVGADKEVAMSVEEDYNAFRRKMEGCEGQRAELRVAEEEEFNSP